MGRRKKKAGDPARSMEELLQRAVVIFGEPYDDRDGRDDKLPSLRAVAEEMGTTILRVRKLLITAEYFSTEASRAVQQMVDEGYGLEQVMEKTGLKRASVYSYLPYKKLAFNLEETTANADRHRVFRQRVKAVDELRRHKDLPDEEAWLWKAMIAFENYPFQTVGRAGRKGVRFTFSVSRTCGREDRHYRGESIEDYGNELWLTVNGVRRGKSISRSTVELGYRRAKELGVVKEPKALELPGSGSYLYPIYLRLGVCSGGED